MILLLALADFVPSGTGNTASPIHATLLSRVPLTLDIDGANPTPLSVVCTSIVGGVYLHERYEQRLCRDSLE